MAGEQGMTADVRRVRAALAPPSMGAGGAPAGADATPSHEYRPEIDGLRAVAVLLVVFFHFDFAVWRGGYVGVDVFFVISGYLITGIIVKSLGSGTFLLSSFYERRARRIFPALFVTILASLAAGLMLMLPLEAENLAKSSLASVLFAANFFFLSQAQYFSGTAETMPLLHTWSLAVEEQFYLFVPLMLMFAVKGAHDFGARARWVLGSLAAISFAISVWLVSYHQESAFYLIISRAWELALGGLLQVRALPAIRRRWLADLVAFAGLGLIIAAAMRFHRDVPFPGALALAPCLGAAAILHGTRTAGGWGRAFLASVPMRGIGLISYSLYLWHWPIVTFARLFAGRTLDLPEKVALILASLLAAWLSWRLVEQPFRHGFGGRRLPIWRWSLGGFGLIAALSALMWAWAGLPFRWSDREVQTASWLSFNDRPAYRRGECFIDSHVSPPSAYKIDVCLREAGGRPALLLMGDSHAAHFWPAVAALGDRYAVMQATASGCKPVLTGRGHATCRAIRDRVFAWIDAQRPEIVILSAQWDMRDLPLLRETIAHLRKTGATVWVFGPIPQYDQALPRLLAQAETRSGAHVARARTHGRAELDDVFRMDLAQSGARYLSLHALLCPRERRDCLTSLNDGTPLQWDYSHLTPAGARHILGQAKDFPQ